MQSDNPPRRMRPLDRLAVLLGVVCLAFAAATIVLPGAIPASDAAGQLVAAAVHAEPARYEAAYEPRVAISTQGFVHATAALAGPLGGVDRSARAVLVAGLLLLALSLGTMARANRRSVGAALALAGAGWVGWPYAMGDFSLLLALSVGASGAALLAAKPRSAASAVGAMLLLGAASWCHAGGALLATAMAVLVVFVAWQRGDASLSRLTVAIPALVWAAWVLSAYIRSDAGDLMSFLPPQWAPAELLALLPGAGAAAYSRYGPVVGLAAWIALGLSTLRGEQVRAARATALACALLLGAVFAVPLHAAGFWFVSLPIAVVALVLLPAVGVPGGAIGAAVAVAALASTAHGLPNARYEGERIAEVVDRIPQDAALGRTYAVVFHPEPAVRMAAGVVPFAATPLYATLRSAAWLPGVPAGTSPLHAMQFAGGAPLLPDPADPYRVWSRDCLRDEACAGTELVQADTIAVASAAWDSVVLAGAPRAVIERLLQRGLTPVLDSRLTLRAAASAILFTFEVPAIASQAALVLRAAYPETIGVFRTVSVDATDGRGDRVPLRLDNVPGGAVTVEAFADLDGDGEPGEGDYFFVRPRTVDLRPGAALTLRPDPTFGGPRP